MVHGTGRGAPFLSRLCVSHLCESFLRKNFPDIAEKQRNGSDNGADIRDRFRIVNAHNAEEMRQNECKRDQKNDFPEQCDKKRNLRLAKTEKGTLYAALQAENCHAGNVDRKHFYHNSNQLRIRGEKTGEKSRAEHCKHNVDESGGKRDSDHAPDRLADAVKLTGTKIVADDRLHTVCEAVDRHKNELQHRLENGHRADV